MTDTLRSNRPNPCNGCPDRYPACSDHCRKPEYLAWKEEQAKIRAARKAYYSLVWSQDEVDKANYRKHLKRR